MQEVSFQALKIISQPAESVLITATRLQGLQPVQPLLTFIIGKAFGEIGVIVGCMNLTILTCLAKRINEESKHRPYAQFVRHELQKRNVDNT